MSTEPKTIKFQLMLSESEAKAIDDWGFENRIRTRAEAIRRLCQIGIEATSEVDDIKNSIESIINTSSIQHSLTYLKYKEHIEGDEDIGELNSRRVDAIERLIEQFYSFYAAVGELKKSGDIEGVIEAAKGEKERVRAQLKPSFQMTPQPKD